MRLAIRTGWWLLAFGAVALGVAMANGQRQDGPCGTCPSGQCPSRTTEAWANIGVIGPRGGAAGIGVGKRMEQTFVDPSNAITESNTRRLYVAWLQCQLLTPNARREPLPGGGYRQATSQDDCGTAAIVKSDTPGMAIVLTAAHVHRGRHDAYRVNVPGTRDKMARLVASDPQQDIAAFLIQDLGDLQFARLGSDPAIGDRVTLCGYGGGRYREIIGRVTGCAERWMVADLRGVVDGDSGAPILDLSNRLVGIHWGGGHFTPISIIRRWFGMSERPAPIVEPAPPLPDPLIPPIHPPQKTVDGWRASVDAVSRRVDGLERRLVAIARQPGPQGPPGERGPQGLSGAPGASYDSSRITAIEQRLVAIEARDNAPLFYSQTWLVDTDADGTVLRREPIDQPTPVQRGQTLYFNIDPTPGSPIESFDVNVTGGAK